MAKKQVPGQLKMFMTPREIRSQYQALDGDRETVWEDDEREETDDELFDRKLDEAQDTNYERYGRRDSGTGTDTYMANASRGSAPVAPRGNNTTALDSYDEHMASWEQRRMDSLSNRRSEWENDSLYDAVRRDGVQHPIRLGTQIGSEGKPQIVGGHHRLAVAAHLAPDQFVPVLHNVGGIGNARAESGDDQPFGRYR